MTIGRGWWPHLVTASWLNKRVMNGTGAWLWNDLQLLLLSVDARCSAAIMSKHTSDLLHRKLQKSPSKTSLWREELWFFFLKSLQLDTTLTFVTTWPSALIRNPSQSALKISSLSSVCMFLHSSTSQSSLPGYHNSHSVPQPQTQPPAKLPHPASRVKVSWLCPPPCSLFHCLSKRLSLWFMSGSFNMRWKGCFLVLVNVQNPGESWQSQSMICPPVERRHCTPLSAGSAGTECTSLYEHLRIF